LKFLSSRPAYYGISIAISVLLIAGSARAQKGGKTRVRELSRSGNTIMLEITLPTPGLDTIQKVVTVRHIAGQISSGDPLASISIPLRVSKLATVAVVSHQDANVRAQNLYLPNTIAADIGYDGTRGSVLHHTKPLTAAHHGIGYAAIHYVGRMRAADISNLEVGFLDRAGANAIRATKKVIVKITDPSGLSTLPITDLSEPFKVSNSVFASRRSSGRPAGKGANAQTSGDVQQLPGIQSDDGNVYRMVIQQDGIYHITFQDIQSNFGVNPATIDPTTLRVVNHGQQVPIYLFDRQSGQFGSSDYFEFYGMAKRYDGLDTLGDFYYDPDTKDNMYYLVWGTHNSPIPAGGLKRLVEESGEIRTANRSTTPRDSFYVDLQDSSYSSTIHYEENRLHDPLNITNVDLRSDLCDHDFMAIVSTGNVYPGSYTTQTVVPYPDLIENGPVKIRVCMHGISDFDPGATDAKGIELPDVPDEDDALITINGHNILHGIWDSQTLKFLSTDTASQLASGTPTAQILSTSGSTNGGVASLSMTFSQQKNTSVNGCRFGVNWIEITYDRLYDAYNDEIDFSAPKNSTAGLYQFTLKNFDRTDISIFRKGVSKISNPVITSNPTEPNSGTAIFQINIVSPADQFIAVVDSEMLKPFAYEKDDFANLHSPSNSGAYLIITNKSHLPKGNNGGNVPLQDLANYRASTNHISTKIVDVANIYDEFRSGAQSANAIQAFLSYAYNNWQDPPKYVLLVGVTHEDMTIPLSPYVPPDQVPAPYIQAYLEGDVAADAWYTMLDGDDLIPDIILGRIATQDINGDATYIAKLKAFEADPATPGDWKDQSFFIGAGGSFDSDIDNLLEHELPSSVSVLRMSTVVGSPYKGTDQNLFDNVNAGLGLMAYFGHGGNAIWDDPIDTTGAPVLTNTDITSFHNVSHYPIVMSMTCFTAGYDGPSVGILNTFQNAANAGSIVSLGTTSFGWEQNDAHLADAVLPNLYDSVGGSIAERITNGKIAFLMTAFSGDLIPPTLMYCYHILGDPLCSPLLSNDRATLSVSNRVIQPGGTVTLSGTSSISQGTARIELVNERRSPLIPPHSVTTPVVNGAFNLNDNVPNPAIPLNYGTYRVIISDKSSNRFAAAGEDVTITDSRVSELDFEPRPLPLSTSLDFSAAVQSPVSGFTDTAIFNIYSQNASGVVTERTLTMQMLPVGDRYHAVVPSAQLNNGDRVVASIMLTAGATATQSDSISIIVGAAVDPSVAKDMFHRTLTGHFVSTSTGLVWNERVYNWGASPLNSGIASLVDVSTGTPRLLGSTNIGNIAPHRDSLISIPLNISSLDSVSLVFAVSPDAGSTPFNLRDSLISNDSTIPIGFPFAAAAYSSGIGTTLNGASASAATFDGNQVAIQLTGVSEGNIARDVTRLNRLNNAVTTAQPDIHFLPLYSQAGKKYSSIRILSDSLGAIPLQDSGSTLSLRVDSLLVQYPGKTIFIYRMDDRTHLWNRLTSTLNGNTLTAKITSLGTFAVAYNTDTKDPIVDIAVQGQVFINNGEVPPQPNIHAVIQDANGIDITPGKTIVKIDNRVLGSTEYVMLDTGRTTTTVNLSMSPSLSSGNHAITVQATDDNGRTNSPAKELDVHVSNQFSIQVLGSYPNPFTKEYMFIAYQIGGVAYASSVSLDIYTVSGRRIRTLNYPSSDPTRTFGFLKGGTGDPTSLGYHEVWWDGRDDSGNEVANGVYFYRLTVNTSNANQQIKGKFARLR